MENSRIQPKVCRCPKVALGKQFGLRDKLVVSAKGQLDVLLKVKSIESVLDSEGNEILEYMLEIEKAELVNSNVDDVKRGIA